MESSLACILYSFTNGSCFCSLDHIRSNIKSCEWMKSCRRHAKATWHYMWSTYNLIDLNFLGTELGKAWDEVFSKGTLEYSEILSSLRSIYGIKQWCSVVQFGDPKMVDRRQWLAAEKAGKYAGWTAKQSTLFECYLELYWFHFVQKRHCKMISQSHLWLIYTSGCYLTSRQQRHKFSFI